MTETNEAAVSEPNPSSGASFSRQTWLYFLGGSSLLACVALAGAGLLAQFLSHRPVNLRPVTVHFADTVESLLQQYYIPKEAIHRQGPELRQDATASLCHYAFDATIPPQVNADRVVEMLSAALRQQLIDVQEIPAENGLRQFSLAVSGLEFARVTLRSQAPPDAPPTADWRPYCARIAEDIRTFLVQYGVPENLVTASAPEEYRDAQALWTTTNLRSPFPEGGSTEEIKAGLDRKLALRDAVTRLNLSVPGEQTIEALYGGKVAARLTFPGPAVPGPDKAAPADINEVVHVALPAFEELPLDSVDLFDGEPETAPKAHAEGEGETEPEPPMARPKPEPKEDLASPAKQNAAPEAKVAIILDDGGYHKPDSEPAFQLDTGLTLSILPNTPHGTELAEAAHALGFEIMLHMPMETHARTIKPFPGQITTKMKEKRIRQLTEEALAQIPQAVGVNNHTGSLFTSDPKRMGFFLEEIKKRGLYFVDSLTISTSEGFKVAEDMGVPAGLRDVFLDNTSDTESIRAQFADLIAIAKRNGHAIGIGHFRKNTVTALQELLPELQKEGVQLVHVSELMQ